MRALKLVQQMKANADRMAEGLIQKIRNSERCSELLLRLSAEEHKGYAVEIYRDLTDRLAAESDSVVESRYVDLGVRRAQQYYVPRRVLGGLYFPRVPLGVHAAGMLTRRAGRVLGWSDATAIAQ
jgi:hypothetical protein